MQSPGKNSPFGRAGDESLQTRAEHGGKERCRDVFVPWLTSALTPLSPLPFPHPRSLSLSFSLSPFSSPGRLSNQEEMLGLSQCRPEDQMCGLEVVRQRRNGNQI